VRHEPFPFFLSLLPRYTLAASSLGCFIPFQLRTLRVLVVDEVKFPFQTQIAIFIFSFPPLSFLFLPFEFIPKSLFFVSPSLHLSTYLVTFPHNLCNLLPNRGMSIPLFSTWGFFSDSIPLSCFPAPFRCLPILHEGVPVYPMYFSLVVWPPSPPFLYIHSFQYSGTLPFLPSSPIDSFSSRSMRFCPGFLSRVVHVS